LKAYEGLNEPLGFFMRLFRQRSKKACRGPERPTKAYLKAYEGLNVKIKIKITNFPVQSYLKNMELKIVKLF
jgi:hypothetical protein